MNSLKVTRLNSTVFVKSYISRDK